MKVSAVAYPTPGGSGIVANATVTINDSFVIHGVKVVADKETGELGVAMPDRQKRDGTYYDTVIPKTKEAYAALKTETLAAYELALQEISRDKQNLEPIDVDVAVTRLREQGGNSKVKADCEITIAESFVIRGVKVYERENGELGVRMPSEQGADGKYRDTAHPITAELHGKIKEVVIAKYEAHEQNKDKIGGTISYGKIIDKSHFTANTAFAERLGDMFRAAGIDYSSVEKGNNKTIICVDEKDRPAVDEIRKEAVKAASKDIDTDIQENITTEEMEQFLSESPEILKEAEKGKTDIDPR